MIGDKIAWDVTTKCDGRAGKVLLVDPIAKYRLL